MPYNIRVRKRDINMSQFKIVYFNRDDYNEIKFVIHNPDMDNSPIGSKVKLTASVITNTRVELLTNQDYYNYSMDDFKTRKVPYLIIVPPKYEKTYKSYTSPRLLKELNKPNNHLIAIYYGDDIADVLVRLCESNSIIDEDEYADEDYL